MTNEERLEAEEAALIARYSDLLPVHWPALLLDLFLEPDRAGQICLEYNSSERDIQRLLRSNKSFRAVASEMKAKVDALGSSEDGFMLKAQIIADGLLPELQRLGRANHIAPSVKLKAIEDIMELAGHKAKAGKQEAVGGASGVTMQINFGPNMPPMSGAPNPNNMTIEAVPTGTD